MNHPYVRQTTDALANSQSISTQMAMGNTAAIKRIRALLKDHSPKVNHHFCPPMIKQADHDKTKQILWGGV